MIESHLISWHVIYNSMIELHILYGMADVNASASIACALRWGVAFVGSFSTMDVAHPVWDNILGAEQTSVDDSH